MSSQPYQLFDYEDDQDPTLDPHYNLYVIHRYDDYGWEGAPNIFNTLDEAQDYFDSIALSRSYGATLVHQGQVIDKRHG